MKLGSSRAMDTKRPRGSERSKPCHELQLTRPSQPPYPWRPEQAQSGVSKPYRTTNPVSAKAISHDWWTQLIAAAMGKVICDPTPTALYRVHGGNASGPKPVGVLPYLKLGLDASFLRRGLGRRIEQANASCRRPCRKN